MSPAAQIAGFLGKYDPSIATFARAARKRLRAQVPGGVELIYDNYNALVFGYGPTERASEAVLSIAIFPRWVTLCFLKGAGLADPEKLLKGGGKVVRHLRPDSPAQLGAPAVQALIRQAIAQYEFPRRRLVRTVIKSISAKQRSRRPSER